MFTPLSRWTLRARLVAAMVTLLALTSLVIGAVSVFALDRYLTHQVSDQLTTAAGRSLGQFESRGDHHDGGPNPLQAPGQGEGTVGATIQNGKLVSAERNDATGTSVALPSAAAQILLNVPADRRQRTVDLGPGLGRYLVVAAPTQDGTVAVTGLPLGGVRAAVTWLAAVVALVTLLGLIAIAVAGTAIARISLRPLNRLAATAARVSELPLERGDVSPDIRVTVEDIDPRTEVGQVGAALDRMLGHIFSALQVRNASEARMRRFVADASHELRTPLASIRGYAELTRHRHDDLAPQVAHALSRVESEAVRMTRLVEELLLLARLDEGAQASALRQDPVDLSELVIDCGSDAHVLSEGHRWVLDLPEDPVTVTGDAARLRQVVTNLLANARVHTPVGTTVTVRLREDHEQAVLEVTDDGPGIAESLLPEVFDRFTRADSSRSRAAGSTGLGLSIVASVVEAHGGRVEVASAPGRTTFTVHLPLAAGLPATPVGAVAVVTAGAV